MRASAVDRVLVFGFIVILAVIKTGTVLETDVFWQVREGQELLSGAALERADTWSWAPIPGVFVPNSPAWAWIVGGAWQLAGSWGLWIVTSLYVSACLVLAVLVARWLGARWIPLTVAFLAAAVCSMPLVSARSSIGSVALLMLATWFGVWFGSGAPARPVVRDGLVLLGVGFALSFAGNWWHASWASLAAVTALAWALAWLLLPGIGIRRGLAYLVSGTVGLAVGEVLGPLGVTGWTRSSDVLAICRGLVTEWSGPFVPGHVFWYGIPVILLLAGTALVLGLMARRWWRHKHLNPRDTLTVLLTGQAFAFALGGLIAIRFIWFAAFLFMPVVARALTRGMGTATEAPAGTSRLRGAIRERTSDGYWRVILGLLLVVLVPVGVYKALPHAYPTTDQAIAALPRDCHLFSTDADANAVLLLRPDVKVWIDGRTDMWGRPRLVEALDRFAGRGTPGLVPEGTTCILLPASGSGDTAETDGLVAGLEQSPDWTVASRAGASVVWVPAAR